SKRMSRDDLALTLKSSKAQAYHVPIRGRLPSPEYSLRGDSQRPMAMARNPTPESLRNAGESGIIAIGMALGSPGEMSNPESGPVAWRMQRAMTAATTGFPEPPEEPQTDQAEQQKSSIWGLFRSKSRRTRPPEPATAQRSLTDNSNNSSASVATRGHRSGSQSKPQAPQDTQKKLPKHKPLVVRSQTDPATPAQAEFKEPVAEKKVAPEETKPTKESKSGGLGRKMSLRALRGDRSRKGAHKEEPMPPPPPPLRTPSPPPPVPQISSSLLDIEIPSIQMERYSVMFGNVLGTQYDPSSLLSRRQATLDRLKTMDQNITEDSQEALPRPRRATSPQPKPSPVFSLFPGAPKDSPIQSSPHRLRSNTTPAPAHSPVRSTLENESINGQEQPRVDILQPTTFLVSESGSPKKMPSPTTDSAHLRSRLAKRAALLPAPRTEKSKQDAVSRRRDESPASLEVDSSPRRRQPSPFTPDTSSLVLDSDNSDDEVEVHITEKLQPTLAEPAWQMISPPVSTTSSFNSEKTRRPSPTRQITVVEPKQELVSHSSEEDLKAAVEISIARQISVSRHQRRMLHPLKSNPSLRRPKMDGVTPGYDIPVGKNERLAETRIAVPRLVRPED
ncbi:hypothetical protein BGZ63DRAFT_330544, partial [Mariannaea sp. PMI_226]